LRLRISKLDRKCGALPVIASFVALEQQINFGENQKRIGLEMAVTSAIEILHIRRPYASLGIYGV